MKRKIIVIILWILISALAGACSSTIQTIEVTRIVPQTVVATHIVTEIATVYITTTPLPTSSLNISPTLTPSPKWTPAFTETPWKILTLTPGSQVIDNTTRPEVEKFVSAQYIRDYLVMNYGHQYFGGKVFCGYTPIGMGNDGNTLKLYIWAECAEYYLKDQILKIGSGMNIPVVLFLELRNGQYKIVNFLDAGGGNRYVQANFPPEIQRIILQVNSYPESILKGMDAVHQELLKEAEAFFGK